MVLTPNERSVYGYVREQARQGVRPTIDQVAEATGVPRSSVGRVAGALGYQGWPDFTAQLQEYFQRNQGDDSGVVEDSVRVICDTLRKHRGQPVMVGSVGDAGVLGSYLIMRLCELGLWAMPYSVLALERCQASGGVLLVLNESGMVLLPACVAAHERDFEVIAITASHDTPVSKVADVNIVIKNQKSTMHSYRPNYFTAGSLSLFERALVRLAAWDEMGKAPGTASRSTGGER